MILNKLPFIFFEIYRFTLIKLELEANGKCNRYEIVALFLHQTVVLSELAIDLIGGYRNCNCITNRFFIVLIFKHNFWETNTISLI